MSRNLAEILRAIYDGCAGVVEFRGLPSRARTFVPPDNLKAASDFVSGRACENVYFGVATRVDVSGGGLEHCLHLPALFSDIDFKMTSVEQARDAMRRFPLKASIVILTGGGAHVYYLLREPIDLRAEASRARDLLRRLAINLGGDLSAAEPARILRVPGTHNYKYTPSRPVNLRRLDVTARYNPIDFDSLLPPEESRASSGSGEPRFSAPDVIGAGARNSTLYKLGRSLKSRGLAEPEILATLLAVNAQRCQPPLGEGEVRTVAHQAATQPDRTTVAGRALRRFEVEVL